MEILSSCKFWNSLTLTLEYSVNPPGKPKDSYQPEDLNASFNHIGIKQINLNLRFRKHTWHSSTFTELENWQQLSIEEELKREPTTQAWKWFRMDSRFEDYRSLAESVSQQEVKDCIKSCKRVWGTDFACRFLSKKKAMIGEDLAEINLGQQSKVYRNYNSQIRLAVRLYTENRTKEEEGQEPRHLQINVVEVFWSVVGENLWTCVWKIRNCLPFRRVRVSGSNRSKILRYHQPFACLDTAKRHFNSHFNSHFNRTSTSFVLL